jgi:hypothetical protein
MPVIIGPGWSIGPGVLIGGDSGIVIFLITEDNNQLITETGDSFVEE